MFTLRMQGYLIEDVGKVWQTKDIIIYGATSSTANIKGIGKTVTLAQALFSLLGYTFFEITSNAGNSKKLWSVLNDLQRKDRATPTLDVRHFRRDAVGIFPRQGQGSAWRYFHSRCTDLHQSDGRILHLLSSLFYGETPHSVSAEVLFTGPLPTSILREFLDELLPFICTMCNVSLQHGRLPESQKEAIVTPILKKHDLDPDDVKSYRPISNLTFISKVIKRIVASQLTGYLQTNKLLPDHQSAYRQGHSTETALLKIFSGILDAADSAQVTLLGLLDLSAAFDTVDHDILPTRLHKSYGVGGTALAWISSFIQGRQQSITFNGNQSARIQLKYGVPQESVLGPLLFILYTSAVISIAASLGVGPHSYADDSQLYLHLRRPTVCRCQIGWVHRKSRGLDEVESAEAELWQDSIHVAWIQTAAVGEDRHKDHDPVADPGGPQGLWPPKRWTHFFHT